MDDYKKCDLFAREYLERMIFAFVLRMSRRKTRRAAMYYFEDMQEELASRLAKKLVKDHQHVVRFLARFRPSASDFFHAADDMLDAVIY